MSARVDAALAKARDDAAHPRATPADGGRRARTLAIGDPQAPLRTFLEILDAKDALGDDGRVREDVALVSMGDHFDWGSRDERVAAAADGSALLAWLAAHPADQVVIIAGNHDLARVGELHDIDDDTFLRIQEKADTIGKDDVAGNEAFRAETGFFTAELVNRDFSTFRTHQRDLVEMLLRERRMKLGYARGDLLFVHAGITMRELDAVGAENASAAGIAAALNHALDVAMETTLPQRKPRSSRSGRDGPLAIAGVHAPGGRTGEGSGALYHRPAYAISDEQRRDGRRFDPRTLPRGVVQVIGHIRDKKCRELLGPWCDSAPSKLGVLRHLVVDAGMLSGREQAAEVRYGHGVPDTIDPRAATMLFLDAGMNDMRTAPAEYQVLDVEKRRAA